MISPALALSGNHNVDFWTSTIGNNNLQFDIDEASGVKIRVQSRELEDISDFSVYDGGSENFKIFDGYVTYTFNLEILTDKDENTGLVFQEVERAVTYAKVESHNMIYHWNREDRKIEYFKAYYNELILQENNMQGYDSDNSGNVFLNPSLREDFIQDRDYGNFSLSIQNKEFVSAPTGIVVLYSDMISRPEYETIVNQAGNSEEVAFQIEDIGTDKEAIDPDAYGDANPDSSFFADLGLKRDTTRYFSDLPIGQYRQTYQQGSWFLHGAGTDDILEEGLRIKNIPDIKFLYEPLTLNYRRIVIDTKGIGAGIHEYTEGVVSTPIRNRIVGAETQQRIQRYNMSVQFHLNSLCELNVRDEAGKPIAEYSNSELADMYRTSLVSNEKGSALVNTDTWWDDFTGILDEFKGLIITIVAVGIIALIVYLNIVTGGAITKAGKSYAKRKAREFERKQAKKLKEEEKKNK